MEEKPKGRFVTRFFVAGVGFRQLNLSTLTPGPVELIPEPENSYDPQAIKVLLKKDHETHEEEIFLGYVPAKNGTNAGIYSRVVAEELDAELILIDTNAKSYNALAIEVREKNEESSDQS